MHPHTAIPLALITYFYILYYPFKLPWRTALLHIFFFALLFITFSNEYLQGKCNLINILATNAKKGIMNGGFDPLIQLITILMIISTIIDLITTAIKGEKQ